MPRVSYAQIIDISPERFLEACDPAELQETLLLLNSPRYSNKMKEPGLNMEVGGAKDPEDPRQIKVPWWDEVKLLKK